MTAKRQRALGKQKAQSIEARKEAILRSALMLFAELGYDATPVPAIARKAEVSVGSLYRYFSTKEDLVNHLYQGLKSQMLDLLTSSIDVSEPSEISFEKIWAGLLAFQNNDPMGFEFLETHCHRTYLDATSIAIEEKILAFSREYVRIGQERGELVQMDPDAMITLVFGIFVAMIKQGGLGRLDLSESIIEQTKQACMRAIFISK